MPALVHLIAPLALFLACTVQAATIQRWTDAQSQVHYGDAAPEGVTVRRNSNTCAPACVPATRPASTTG